MNLKLFLASAVSAVVLLEASAVNLLPNGDFEKTGKQTDFPAEWNKGVYGEAKADFKLVDHDNGKALRIINLNKNEWVECLSSNMPVKINSTCLFEVSGMLKAENIKSGSVVLMGSDEKGKRNFWKILYNIPSNSSWKKIKTFAFVPADVKKIRLSLRINKGEGSVLFDNFEVSQTEGSFPEGVQLLKNEWLGVYKKEQSIPEFWTQKSWSAMETSFKITADKQGAKLQWVAGGAKFGIQPELWLSSVPAGTNLKMTARYRVYGEGKAVVMAEFFDKDARKIDEQASEEGLSGNWGNIDHIFAVPENTAEMKFYLLNRGRGTVRYISAALTTVAQTAVKKKFPVTVYCSPAEGNRIIYNGRNVFNTIVDSPNSLSFDFWGHRKGLKNPALVVEVPAALKIAGCFNSHPAIISEAIPDICDIQIGGKPYKRYVYKNLKAFSMMEPVIRWRRQVVMAFEPVDSSISLPAEYKTWFYMQDDNLTGAKKKLFIRVLPAMEKLPNPKNFPVYNWADGDINFPDKNLFMRVISKYEEANLNSRQREWRPVLQAMDKILEKRGWYMHNPEQDYTQTRIVRTLTNDLKDARIAVNANGKEYKEHICPGYFLNDQKFTDNLVNFMEDKYRKLEAKSGDYVLLDYEPWRTMDWCLCPECRTDFSRKVNSSKVLSAKEIISVYPEKWVDFRIQQTAAINRKTASIIKKIVPGAIIVDYDYPVKFDKADYRNFFKSVPKDPRSYEDCIDIHFSSFYHYLNKNAFELIDVNVKNLKRPVYMTPLLSRNDPLQGSYTTDEETLSPRQFRLTMLGAACSGSKGLCIYPGIQIDGLFFKEINKGMGEIAAIEGFLDKGKRIDSKVKLKPRPNKEIKTGGNMIRLPQWKPFSGYRAHKVGDELLVSLFNFHTRYNLFTGLDIDENILPEKIAVCNIVTGSHILPSSGKGFWTKKELAQLLLKVPTLDAKFYVIKPYSDENKSISAKNNSVILEEYEKELKNDESSSFEPLVKGDSKALMTDVNADGIPEIEISTPQQKLAISLKGGVILEWKARSLVIESGKGVQNKDSMCWDYFWIPMMKYSSNNQPYILRSVKYENNNFQVNMATDFKTTNLRLEKNYIVSTLNPLIKVVFRITNTDDNAKTVSFWSHNFWDLGAENALNELKFSIGKFSVVGEGKNEQVFCYKNNKAIKFAKSKVIGSFDSTTVLCINNKTNTSVKIELDPVFLNQVYLYRGKNPTFEWMTREVLLSPKQSFSTWMQFSLPQK
jgi:hypothetical protein